MEREAAEMLVRRIENFVLAIVAAKSPGATGHKEKQAVLDECRASLIKVLGG